jgi:hypothetical protein
MLPYHELVYHLDLCILSYHLYSQTLIWPMDPYYEQMAQSGGESRRRDFMTQVREAQPRPGVYPPALDPIISDYGSINPWMPCFVKPEPGSIPWLVFQAPSEITASIRDTYMVQIGTISSIMRINIINPNGGEGTDSLYCFEGKTGLIQTGEEVTSGLKSMMGFVLERQNPDRSYDIHIAFRGSRSGSGTRAAKEAVSSRGNPDWITDIDSVRQTVNDPQISPKGRCSRGFGNSIKTMIRPIIAALKHIHDRRKVSPRAIYVTGHSLGGALASLFSSAISLCLEEQDLIENHPLISWPWEALRLITFGAPTVGDMDFHYAVNSKVYAKRVVLGKDPITQKQILYHVGARTNLPIPPSDEFVNTTSKALNLFHHEPDRIRDMLTEWVHALGNTDQFPDNPWQKRRYFNDVISRSVFNAANPVFNNTHPIQAILGTSFHNNLVQYLDILARTLSPEKRPFIAALSAQIQTNDVGGDLNNVIDRWRVLSAQFRNDYLTKFLGLCVILHGFNVEPAAVLEQLEADVNIKRVIISGL